MVRQESGVQPPEMLMSGQKRVYNHQSCFHSDIFMHRNNLFCSVAKEGSLNYTILTLYPATPAHGTPESQQVLEFIAKSIETAQVPLETN